MTDFSPWRAAFSGVRFIIERPLIVLAWAALTGVTALPAAILLSIVFASGLGGLLAALLKAFPILFVAGFATAVVGNATRAAAVRSVTCPEDSRFAYLRLLDRRRPVVVTHRVPDAPARTQVLLFLVSALATIVVFGSDADLWWLVAAWLPTLGYGVYLSIRLSLMREAAERRSDDAQASWDATEGQTAAVLAVHATAYLTWVAAAGALIYAAALIAAWAWQAPLASIGWTVLERLRPTDWRSGIAPLPLALLGLYGLIGALRLALCVRASAETYRALSTS